MAVCDNMLRRKDRGRIIAFLIPVQIINYQVLFGGRTL